MKKSRNINITKLKKSLYKKYGKHELFPFIMTYAEGVDLCSKIRYPHFFDCVKMSVTDKYLTDVEQIASVMGEDDFSYSALRYFYSYAVICALCGLESSPYSEELLCRTSEYFKGLFSIPVRDIYFRLSKAERILNESPYFYGCDESTQNACRNRTIRLSKQLNLSESEVAELFRERDPFENKNKVFSLLYFPLLALISVSLCVLAYTVIRNSAVLFFLILPLTECGKQLCDFFFSYIVPVEPIPKKKLKSIPNKARTLTVITCLLTGKESDLELLTKLRNCYFANKDPNAYFGILCDLKEADCKTVPADLECEKRVKEALEEMNRKHGCELYFFLRERTYSPSENKYMGWERKRGAIIELCRMLRSRRTGIRTVVGDAEALKNINYILTLDSDTRLYVGALKDMLGAMLHPSNTPKIENGRVVSGYGVLQPRMECSLTSAEKTPFAILSAGNGGSDIYATASYETYQSVFGEGIFCGKGIFDINAFMSVIDKTFPDGAVLSHDLLEGCYLRAGAVNDISLTDDLPKSPLSCFERSHRWLRGDVQALAFAGKYHRNSEGKIVKNPISALSRFKIYDNIRRGLTPVFSVCALLLCIFRPDYVSPYIALFALSYLFLPFILSIVTVIRTSRRRFFSFLLPEAVSSFENLLYSLSSILHVALNNLDAVFRASYRMLFSRKKLLEWKTASESDSIKGLPLYIYRMLPSLLTGLSLLFFCNRLPLKVLGALFALFPFAAWRIGKPIKKKYDISAKEKKKLLQYGKDIYKFFSDNVTKSDNYLPPDNIIISPDEKTAHRTSPTNIGLYLISCFASYKLGYISLNEALNRISNTVNTLKELPKWHGHLYNWYDTETLMILGAPYVSTVDSGNFITSLVALNQAIQNEDIPEYFSSLKETVSSLIDNADFSLLYDEKEKLFTIGINTETGKRDGYYDFYASEARTTSFFAIASSQVPREHWRSLRRLLTTSDGYLGLLSWTGTAFEYLMPSLLLPTISMSLNYEALFYAVREQKKAAVKGVWGQSESGYYHFDSDLNYQYKAFGISSLGIKRGLENDSVISPYSTFLSLPFGIDSALGNLKRLEEKGMYGLYGFYEAIDFTQQRVGKGNAIVRSYMSHHMGMSLISCANVLCDNFFVKMFMSDPRCACAVDLLEEKVPMNAVIHKLKKPKNPLNIPSFSPHFMVDENISGKDEARLCLMSENSLSAVYYNGNLALNSKKEQVSLNPFVFGSIYRPRFLFSVDGKLYDAFDSKVSGGIGKSSITFFQRKRSFESICSFSILGRYSSFVFSLSLKGDFKSVCPLFMFIPSLSSTQSRLSHPAYCDLMVMSSYDENEGILTYIKRGKEKGESCIAVSSEGNRKFDFISKRDILPSCYTEKDIENLINVPFDNKCRQSVNPFCALKKQSETNGRYSCNFIITAAKSKEEALLKIKEAKAFLRKQKGSSYADKTARLYAKSIKERLAITKNRLCFDKICKNVLDGIFLSRENTLTNKTYKINDLWKYGISGDNPIITVILTERHESKVVKEIIKTFISLHKFLAFSSVKADTVIIYEDKGEYICPQKEMILSCAEECGGAFFLKGGGIHTVASMENVELFESISAFVLHLNSAFTPSSIPQIQRKENPKPIPVRNVIGESSVKENALNVSYGAFTEQGFVIYKKEKPVSCPPLSYVYAKNHFGTLVTDSSLGYTWIGNCSQRRISVYNPDNLLGMSGEILIGQINGREYDLAACSHTVTFGHGGAVWEGCIEGISYTVSASVHPKLPFKAVTVQSDIGFEARYVLDAVLGEKPNVNRKIRVKEYPYENGELKIYTPVLADENGGDEAFLYTKKEDGFTFFILGAHPMQSYKTREHILSKYSSTEKILRCKTEYENDIKRHLPVIKLNMPDQYLNVMTEYYLPYQALVCRFLGRTGFYQSGGAYGFRDQLQDCLCIMLSSPMTVRTHILRCACRQYEEGDVNHWWHIVRGRIKGVRTRYSDDLLFLPYVVSKYVSFTGDRSILDIKLPYISSPELYDSEKDRYESANRSSYKESLYHHCVRAIERSLVFGEKGLPLMNGGDWNDGMNAVSGESVWLGMFLCLVLKSFAPIAQMCSDVLGSHKYRRIASELLENIEKTYKDGRYLRAFFENGTAISDNTFIDILPQAFSVFAGCDRTKSENALKQTYFRLFDIRNSVFALLDPPFDRPCARDVGYISSYPRGVRENGGQYTHAAVWGAMAMASISLKNEAYNVLKTINPALICSTKEGSDRYLGEAYFVAGDVSTSPSFKGRCGWSIYTGASGWYFNAVFACLLGIRIEGDTFSIKPSLCYDFTGYSITFTHRNTTYDIVVKTGNESSCSLDGKSSSNLFYFDKKRHYIEITIENSQ